MKLAYLSDMFQNLNELNLQMQGSSPHLPQQADKITSFTRKLEVWAQRVKEGNIDSFENLKSFIEVNKLQNTLIPMYENSYVCPTKAFPEVLHGAGSCKI